MGRQRGALPCSTSDRMRKGKAGSRNPVWRNAPSDDELDLIRPTLEELESLFEPLTSRISFETKPAIIFRCEPETK